MKGLLKWRSDVTIGLLLTVLTIVIAYGSMRLARQQLTRDEPALHLELKTGTPLYSIDTGTTWRADLVSTRLREFLRARFALAVLPVYVSNGLVNADARIVFEEKMRTFEKDMSRLMVRVPLRMTLANNGHRDTTIVSGSLLVTGYENQSNRARDLGELQIFIAEGTVTNLAKFRNVEFPNPEATPKTFILEVASGPAREMMSEFLPADSAIQANIPTIFRTVLGLGFPEIRDLPRPNVIVELVDQRGDRCQAACPLYSQTSFDVTGISESQLDEASKAPAAN